MHLCCEGYIKRFLKLILHPPNKKRNLHFSTEYYIGTYFFSISIFITLLLCLGKELKSLNKNYKEIKVPHSFARSIRDFSSLAYWKANEFKVFMLYSGVPSLINTLPTAYFEHFCLYVLILRKLCDRELNINEIDNLDKLLSIWHKGVETLYGIFELTYNAHAHLHLAQQVFQFIYFYK